MLGNLQGWHFIIIVVVVLLLFGAPKLPALAKSLGQSMRIFKGEIKTMKDENNSDSKKTKDADVPESTDRESTDRPDDRPFTDSTPRSSSSDPLNKP